MNVTYQHNEQYSIMVCSVDSKSCVMKMYTISYFCRDVTPLLYFSAVLFSGSNSLMDLMVSFSMKYFNWTSSCFSFLAVVLGVGWHDVGRLKTLDWRAGREYPPGNFTPGECLGISQMKNLAGLIWKPFRCGSTFSEVWLSLSSVSNLKTQHFVFIVVVPISVSKILLVLHTVANLIRRRKHNDKK